MRILKNILIYALPALMLCNTSCDYLDKEPENKVPEEYALGDMAIVCRA